MPARTALLRSPAAAPAVAPGCSTVLVLGARRDPRQLAQRIIGPSPPCDVRVNHVYARSPAAVYSLLVYIICCIEHHVADVAGQRVLPAVRAGWLLPPVPRMLLPVELCERSACVVCERGACVSGFASKWAATGICRGTISERVQSPLLRRGRAVAWVLLVFSAFARPAVCLPVHPMVQGQCPVCAMCRWLARRACKAARAVIRCW